MGSDQRFLFQTGVLKSLCLMLEYIGEMSRDYIYALVPILESTLIERDGVHRQSACFAIAHLSLGVAGLSCEDPLLHLLNFVWPNIFEHSKHSHQSFICSFEGYRNSLGAKPLLLYLVR